MSKLSKLYNQPDLFFIDFLKKRINKRFGFLFRSTGNAVVLIAREAVKHTWTEKMMHLAYTSGEPHIIAYIFSEFCQKFQPSLWAVTFYIAKAVNNGEIEALPKNIEKSCIHPNHLPLLKSALLRAKGDYTGALAALNFYSPCQAVRFKMALAERSIYHALRDKEGLAKSSLEFIQSEPQMILMEYALNAAGAAEVVNRRDIMALCLKRALGDIKRVINSEKIFIRYWQEAIRIALRLYRIEDAMRIAQKARKMGLKKARSELEHINEIHHQVSDWRWAVNAARRAVQAAANGKFLDYKDKAVVVVHSAAFSRNAIDYTGFRSDIRFCYSKIIAALISLRIKPKIIFKLSTHGKILQETPYFSYHTISENEMGCHFKETDRPHSFSFDETGYSGWAKFAKIGCDTPIIKNIDPTIAKVFFTSEQEKVFSKGLTKYRQPIAHLGKKLPKKYIFIGLQMQSDVVQELAYCNMETMIDEVCKVAGQFGLKVIVKRHPYCRAGIVAGFLAKYEKAGKIIVKNGNVHELIKNSQAVCVINSSVGAEALLFEKPVYVFGASEYMAGCFICKKTGDFKKNFKLGKQRLDSQTLRKFWFALKNEYSINFSNKLDVEKLIRNKVINHLLLNNFLKNSLVE